jgi:hypothetical protein
MLRLRKELDVFANLRPARSMLVEEDRFGTFDIMLVREAVGGLDFSPHRGRTNEADPRAFDTMEYSASQIRRTLRVALDLARARRAKVLSVDKANVLASSRLIEAGPPVLDVRAQGCGEGPGARAVIGEHGLHGEPVGGEETRPRGPRGPRPPVGTGRAPLSAAGSSLLPELGVRVSFWL